MSEYLWTGDAGDDDFGDGDNWLNVNTDMLGEPGSSDVAVVETAGTINGSGNVAILDLISSGGALTTQALTVSANSMDLAGSLTFFSGTQFAITDDVEQVGTSTIIQSNGVSMDISGSDGTAGDLVTAMEFGQSASDQVAYTLTGLGTLLDASDGNIMIAGDGTATVTVSAGATLEADDASQNGGGNVYLGGAADAQATLNVTGADTLLYLSGILDVGEVGTGHFTLSGGADAQIGQSYGSECWSWGTAWAAQATLSSPVRARVWTATWLVRP